MIGRNARGMGEAPRPLAAGLGIGAASLLPPSTHAPKHPRSQACSHHFGASLGEGRTARPSPPTFSPQFRHLGFDFTTGDCTATRRQRVKPPLCVGA